MGAPAVLVTATVEAAKQESRKRFLVISRARTKSCV